MKKIVRITENDLTRIVKRVMDEGIVIGTPKRTDCRGDATHKNATPEEITDFIKNGGSIYNSSNKEVSGDGTNGYKFQSVKSDGRVVLRWRKGEGLALIIDPKNKTWEIYERGGMSDRWSVTSDGSFLFGGEKIKLC